MRYLGGTLGGTWLTALAGDLGNGIFDGANLVANFRSLESGQHLLGEGLQRRLLKVDTEASRFLDFETWWGSPVLLNAGEMQWIADNLFVGNKLTSGEIRTSDGVRVDLRNITLADHRAVLVGRQHHAAAAGAGLDHRPLRPRATRSSANGQTIVYTLHQTIGHLGIFVSGKVATKEHAEFASCMDMIDLMPPGLYEAVITEVDDRHRPSPTCIHGKYLFRPGARARWTTSARWAPTATRTTSAFATAVAACRRSTTASTARSPSRRCGR